MPAITGKYLLQNLAQRVHQPYTNFLGGQVKANRLFLDAILALLENRFDEVEFQKYRDEINFLIQTNKVFGLNSNQVYEAPLQIIGINIIGTVATVVTYLPHNLVNGNFVTLAGVQGFATNPNGQFVATILTAFTFQINIIAPTTGAYIPNTGSIVQANNATLQNLMIPNYWQMIQVSARYDVLYSGVNITAATNATPIVITLSKRTDLRTGSRVFNAGATGNTNVNGTVYLKKLNDFTFSLYSDPYFLTPVAGNGAFAGTVTISKVNYKTCKPFLPMTKISPLGTPSADAPRYKDSEKMLKFYPQDITCKEITGDFYKYPDVLIDTADDVIDLSQYYGAHFLINGLLSVAERLFAMESRDPLLYQESQQQIRQDN